MTAAEHLFPLSRRTRVRIAAFLGAGLLLVTALWGQQTGLLSVSPNISVSGLLPPEPPAYRLGSHRGKLAVYHHGEEEPFLVFQVYLHNLPEQDQAELTRGLEVRDYRELDRLLEDYTS